MIIESESDKLEFFFLVKSEASISVFSKNELWTRITCKFLGFTGMLRLVLRVDNIDSATSCTQNTMQRAPHQMNKDP
ncbi:uncharacterized protein LACBIDRAFT_316163 [Laccaria bicolor S238N-H82]|uniref:Predicted protein n=1 Tax=Laccaria bicolor (strain S238N-H82 / ATCC MYA-4686) TaxID=486041 RepID=B0E0B6_LACBS|nr:uncharacterized protein LACBIDRAFT_316163 [Laccaria bicolor S238N-H82]EDQ99654.1 predicted protein [Laccaria bicolor S238N-H82]|eukprot:XP_001889631.1 predicted protein [Laccaria bicolor S238N-H82]